jgi:hypothetical protein
MLAGPAGPALTRNRELQAEMRNIPPQVFLKHHT